MREANGTESASEQIYQLIARARAHGVHSGGDFDGRTCGTDPNRCAVLCANLGGDTDTIGAMATAICGALHGVQAIDPALKSELDAVNPLDFGRSCEKLLHFREQREGV
ncbi:MAG: ADP-ribosylglycohydrolase family protein [Enterobacter hormaechei]